MRKEARTRNYICNFFLDAARQHRTTLTFRLCCAMTEDINSIFEASPLRRSVFLAERTAPDNEQFSGQITQPFCTFLVCEAADRAVVSRMDAEVFRRFLLETERTAPVDNDVTSTSCGTVSSSETWCQDKQMTASLRGLNDRRLSYLSNQIGIRDHAKLVILPCQIQRTLLACIFSILQVFPTSQCGQCRSPCAISYSDRGKPHVLLRISSQDRQHTLVHNTHTHTHTHTFKNHEKRTVKLTARNIFSAFFRLKFLAVKKKSSPIGFLTRKRARFRCGQFPSNPGSGRKANLSVQDKLVNCRGSIKRAFQQVS